MEQNKAKRLNENVTEKMCSSDGNVVGEMCSPADTDTYRTYGGKFSPITYDPVHHGYYRLGERVGNAFKHGEKLK